MTDQPPSQHDTQPFEPVSPEPASPGLAGSATATGSGGSTFATAPVPPATARPGSARSGGMNWVNVALGVALAIAIGGVGFAAGRMTAPASTFGPGDGTGRLGNGAFPGGGSFRGGYFPGGFNGDDGTGGGRGFLGGGGATIEGTVESVSGDTLTLKLTNGSTIQVSLSGTTTYHSQTSATAGDVQTGGTVIVRVGLDRGTGNGGATSPSATDVTIVP